MYTFLTLSPVLQIIDIRTLSKIIPKYLSEDFELLKIKNDDKNLTFFVTFSEKYIQRWSEKRWQGASGKENIMRYLSDVHGISVNRLGVITIVTHASEEYNELARHYVNICRNIITALEKNNQVAKLLLTETNNPINKEQPKESEAIYFYVHGSNKDLDSLGLAINERIESLIKEQYHVFNIVLKRIVRGAKGRFNFLSPISNKADRLYLDMAEFEKRSNGFLHVFRVYTNSIRRVNEINNLDSWYVAKENSESILSNLGGSVNRIEIAFKSYSDYLAMVGIYTTLGGIGLGIFFAGFAISEEISKWIVIGSGASIVTLDIIFWLRSKIKSSVTGSLASISSLLK